MKRYKMSGHHGGPHGKAIEIEAVESNFGEWVKYKDVRDIEGLSQCKEQLCNLGVTLESESIECNCKEEVAKRTLLSPYWFCPMHGYKKM